MVSPFPFYQMPQLRGPNSARFTPHYSGSEPKPSLTVTEEKEDDGEDFEALQNLVDSDKFKKMSMPPQDEQEAAEPDEQLPEVMREPMITPNVYENPAEAIAPNGRYLIKFKVTKVKDRNAPDDEFQQDDNINLDSQRIKKDALYKPLLRKFRAFLRKVFDGLGLSKGCHYWASDKMIQQVMVFVVKIRLPMHMRTPKTYAMLTVMLFPATIKKRPENKNYYNELGRYHSEIKDTCFEIFRENNIQKRLKFFSCPVIQALWTFMIKLKPEIVFNHLRRARSFPYKGECRF